MANRAWVIEGKTDGIWFPLVGMLFTNKHKGWLQLRQVRNKWSSEYSADTFRLVEYERKRNG